MSYIYEAIIKDEETDDIIGKISSYSQEGLEEEMGKRKWANAVEYYEEKRISELQESIEELENDLKDDDIIPANKKQTFFNILCGEKKELEAILSNS